MKVEAILNQIDLGAIALPEFQRGYVWNREQVRGLMHSLYRKHPVGSLLVWATGSDGANARGNGKLSPGVVKLLLDGQQRITSLYGIIRGRPPKFFDGNKQAFEGLYFNLEEEIFEFYTPLKMKDNPFWINVTQIMQDGVGPAIGRILPIPEIQPSLNNYISRLSAIDAIKDIDLHMEEVAGDDKTIDVVVDIFNRVNSGGTKLSKGDLALAKICVEWPEARQEMKERLAHWQKAGFEFELDWLLRNINVILTGDALFSALKDVDGATFQLGLKQAEKACDYLLNIISGRLGLDHDRVLGGRYAFPIMARYLVKHDGKLKDGQEQDKLLYWYVQTFLWGRYSASVESILNRDLKAIEGTEGSLDRLIEQVTQWRGDLKIRSDDFKGSSLGARFYPMLYLLTRTCGARDWGTGIPLSASMLGKLNKLQVHHIFPKALLYAQGYRKDEVNAIANYCFQTQITNLEISDKNPEHYLEKIEQKHPGALASQWIPQDRDLWKVENYRDFLAARRESLANAANELLDSLISGPSPDVQIGVPMVEKAEAPVPGGFASQEEDQAIQEINEWVITQGLPKGQSLYELTDADTNKPLAILDLAWPEGLQREYSQPVALLIDEGKDTEEAANRAGFRFFTDFDSFRHYVVQEILALEEAVV